MRKFFTQTSTMRFALNDIKFFKNYYEMEFRVMTVAVNAMHINPFDEI